jgi:hypothetical protein
LQEALAYLSSIPKPTRTEQKTHHGTLTSKRQRRREQRARRGASRGAAPYSFHAASKSHHRAVDRSYSSGGVRVVPGRAQHASLLAPRLRVLRTPPLPQQPMPRPRGPGRHWGGMRCRKGGAASYGDPPPSYLLYLIVDSSFVLLAKKDCVTMRLATRIFGDFVCSMRTIITRSNQLTVLLSLFSFPRTVNSSFVPLFWPPENEKRNKNLLSLSRSVTVLLLGGLRVERHAMQRKSRQHF